MSRRPPFRPKQCPTTETILAVERQDLPADSVACLVAAVLEALLFERGQVPCVVKLLQRAEIQDSAADVDGGARISSQRRERRKFLEQLQCVEELLEASIASMSVKRVALLLGSTTISAKEVYEIDLMGITKLASADAVNNERLCRSSLISILSGDMEWSRSLKAARRVMRVHVLLLTEDTPPPNLGLCPVRAFRISRTASHVRFMAQCPASQHASDSKVAGARLFAGGIESEEGDSGGVLSEGAVSSLTALDGDQAAVSEPVEETRCEEDRTCNDAESASVDHGLASLSDMVETLALAEPSAGSTDSAPKATSSLNSGLAVASLPNDMTEESGDFWFLVPVVLKGFTMLRRAN